MKSEAETDVLLDIYAIPYKTDENKNERRRIRTMNSKTLPIQSIYFNLFKRASVSASKKKDTNGSITIEAALAVPVFFLAVVSLLYLMEIMALRTSVRCGLQYAGKVAAGEAYIVTAVMPSQLEKDVIHAIGADRLERSIILGGCNGIRCDESRVSLRTGIGKLTASYQIRLPVLLFKVPPIEYREEIRIKVWSGYEKEGFLTDDEETVYITETGLVYHRDYHCTHLELSIRMVSSAELESLRNNSGGRYYPCGQCVRLGKNGVYITNTGDRYHSSLSCSGLKRTIYAVPVSEAVGRRACSRCGK